MALDLVNIAPARRAELISAGQKFGSDVVLAQGRRTLTALALHGAKLVDYGFSADDGVELKDGCDELIAAGVGREQRRTDKKQSGFEYERTLKDGQEVRLRGRSVLGSGRRALSRLATPEAAKAVELIDSVLERCAVAPEEAGLMATQLDELRRVLEDPIVTPAVTSRGGPKAVTDLTSRAGELRAIEQATAMPRGTPEHTEKLDLVDGIVLELVRSAREAAEAASKALGEPALLTAFTLSELYGSSGGSTSTGDAPKVTGAQA